MVTLLDEVALLRSEVVANACMNRTRNLAGVNSYEKDLGLSPLDYLLKALENQRQVAWLDLCCGSGRAVIQAAEAFGAAGLARRARLHGIDLVPMFDPIPPGIGNLVLTSTPIEYGAPEERFDLVTCVHGLHYVGDKLGMLEKASTWLKNDGLLLMHLDYKNLRVSGSSCARTLIGRDLRRSGFRYFTGRRLITRKGPIVRLLPYYYLGADEKAGPNCTGQPAVDSYYQRRV